MTSKNLVDKLIDIAKNYKTLYVMGCFGAPLTVPNKKRYIVAWEYNSRPERAQMINNAQPDTFGFDCVNLIKAVLWGWSGDATANYGGAKYQSNKVPDVSANQMINLCTNVSTSGWDEMLPGEAVWMQGHIGVYIGDGLVVECSPRWKNSVQITACANIGTRAGYPARSWTRHGMLPWVTYKEKQQKGKDTVIYFTGGKHYSNSMATEGYNVSAGRATITAVREGAKHPYHIIHTPDSTSKVYGWVDSDTIRKE